MSGHGWVRARPEGTREACGGPGVCVACGLEAAQAGFHGELGHLAEPAPRQVSCPSCGGRFAPGLLARATEADDGDTPYGEVEYADPGYQTDGKSRYPIDTAKHVRAAWSYINKETNAAKYKKGDLNRVRARIKRAARTFKVQLAETAAEAMINGKLSYSDVQELVGAALRKRARQALGGYCWVWVVDLTDTEVVYQADDTGLYQCSYTLATGEDGTTTVQLGEAVEVARTYAPLTAAGEETSGDGAVTEARAQIIGRVIEAKASTESGGRIFRVRVIAYGDSKNGRRYPEAVLREAAALYEGAGAYDHHRDDAELRSSTIAGLVGHYRGVEATTQGLEADLHLLPSATHAAEALDASLAAQAEGLAPVVGISHDVMAEWRPIRVGTRQLQEAVAIRKVNSVDIVASPAAGGQATRAVAGGIDPDPAGEAPAGDSMEEDSVTTTESVLAALGTATDEQLAAVGLRKATAPAPATEATTTPAAPPPVPDGEPKDSFLGKLLIRTKVLDAGLPETAVESVAEALPERVTESTVDTHIATLKASLAAIERAGLAPQHAGTAQVTQEALDKKRAALDSFFAADYSKGYRSFREAFCDITGLRPRALDEDFNRTMLRESIGAPGGFDSARRSTESLTTSSWDAILGDSITRRMAVEYTRPNLQTWQAIVSSKVPVNDFRTQRVDRLGGYGTLPAVNQGAPYQSLTSPGDEEATYAITKRGGTEDLTLEMIANDDIRSIQRIPVKLGLAAAQTLFRFVWDILPTNAATSYDSTALFHANHGNTDNPAVLGQSTLATGRKKMRQQTAYGDTSDVLSIIPRTLVVPSALEEIAYQLVTSAVAIPSTPAGPSDTPNIHQGMQMIVVDYYSDANDWYLVCDTDLCPTIEIGFYQGRETPELFTQSDPQVGSMFDADKLTWKIRHIYSGVVIDHRGFYRGAN